MTEPTDSSPASFVAQSHHGIGRIRGGEAFDLLQLLNTGHNGTFSTVHANSAAQGISRFTTCVLQSGVEMLT
jgi:pilus assembly protein CpaF